MIKTLTLDFFEQFGEIQRDIASNNKVFPYNGVGFIYGKPASRKTTIAIDTVKSMEFDEKIYIDCDSKTTYQAKETFINLSNEGFKYRNSLLEGEIPLNVLYQTIHAIQELNDKKKRCVVVDTWHQLIDKENDNDKVKNLMQELRMLAQKHNTLIVLIAHIGHSTDDIRGASAVSGDATFKVLVEKTDKEDEFSINITKDSLGLLKSGTAIITKKSSISTSKFKYSSSIKEETKVKPKEAALQATMINYVTEQFKNGAERIDVSDLRDWLYDNYNTYNKFTPSHPLFLSNKYVRVNFTDFYTSIFTWVQEGRKRYITGLREENK